jgi:hypothetical protein
LARRKTSASFYSVQKSDGANLSFEGKLWQAAMCGLTEKLEEQFGELARLEVAIRANLRGLEYGK